MPRPFSIPRKDAILPACFAASMSAARELEPRAAAVDRGDPHAPELPRELALGEPREVGLVGRVRAQVVAGEVAARVLTHEPGQVVVAVDERHPAEQLTGVAERRVLLRGGERRERERGGEQQGGSQHAPIPPRSGRARIRASERVG
jgi:hypothetical protein